MATEHLHIRLQRAETLMELGASLTTALGVADVELRELLDGVAASDSGVTRRALRLLLMAEHARGLPGEHDAR